MQPNTNFHKETRRGRNYWFLGYCKVLCFQDRSAVSGPDGNPLILLKECADVLAPTLHALFRQTLDSGVVPEIWKDAIVTPIHNKGYRHQTESYRSISLTNTVCKVMERQIVTRSWILLFKIEWFLNSIMDSYQFVRILLRKICDSN